MRANSHRLLLNSRCYSYLNDSIGSRFAAFRAELQQLALPKEKPVKIWVADKSRFGLHTQSRRCWALRGWRVVIPQPQRYEWEHVYGALEVLAGDAQFAAMKPWMTWSRP